MRPLQADHAGSRGPSELVSADALLSIIAGRDTTGLFEVRCRRPSDGRIKAREWFALEDRGGCQQFIAAHAKRLDVFVGVAPRTERAGGKASIRHSWLLYVDADNAEAAERVRAFTPRPSLIVRSGTGENVHAYWALSEPLPSVWVARANRRLAHHLGADTKATDVARILRPPGSLNHKHEPPIPVSICYNALDAQNLGPLDAGPVGDALLIGTSVTNSSHAGSADKTSNPAPRMASPLSDGSVHSVASLVKNLPDPPSFRPSQPRPDSDCNDPLLGVSADRYYTTLTGRPVSHGNVTCPFHSDGKERTPSLRLYDTTWFCFGCGEGGSVFEFAAKLWGLGTRGADFLELRERLTDALG